MDPSSSATRLAEAIRENRIDLVRARLIECPSALTSTVDFLGHTLLHLAAMHGQCETASLLLSMGAHASAGSKEGRTPLHFACQLGDLRMSEILVRHGANVNAQDSFKMTPLHWAVEKNHVDIVRLLCEQSDVDVNIADRQGRTCLATATKKGNSCLLDILNKKLSGLTIHTQSNNSLHGGIRTQLPTTRPVIDSSMIPTNPFGKRKSFAKALPVNCRTNYPLIAENLPAAHSTVLNVEKMDEETVPKPPSESIPMNPLPNKNKVRIDVLDESSSDEEYDNSFRFGGHKSRGLGRSDEDSSKSSKKRQLSFSPNTILDDTLYWLKRQALANSSSDLSSDFSLGGRELSLTEAGRLALKYMNENDSIRSEKSLFIKLAKTYEQENEEMAKSASNSSLNSTSGIDALMSALDQQLEEDPPISQTDTDPSAYSRSQIVRSDFFSQLIDESQSGTVNMLNGLLATSDSNIQPSATSESLNLFNLNLLTDELNLNQ